MSIFSSVESLGSKIKNIFSKQIDEDYFDELFALLVQADISIDLADYLVQQTKKKAKTTQDVLPLLKQAIKDNYSNRKFELIEKKNTVIMMVGVNGCGKTTSISKLANLYLSKGYSVGLIAADTFRAGAKDQLLNWAKRLNISCQTGNDNQDPSSVIVAGCQYYQENPVDYILIDTAGRLQNKANLMNELSKMKRVIQKVFNDQPTYIWLTIDATTGQNGLLQAEHFIKSSDVNGIILTKMDGTSKGGVVLSIYNQYNIDVIYSTFGENIEAISQFDMDEYLDKLLK